MTHILSPPEGTTWQHLRTGAILLYATGAPEALMAGFIVFKIVADVVAHLREHSPGRPDGLPES